jgi:predicted ribosome quality control (RQC) complex YloA/Tae2 family protein
MKTEIIYIDALKREFTFYIEKNQNDNFEVIDKCTSSDLWFHANNVSSCHVLCIIPDILCKKILNTSSKYVHFCVKTIQVN